MVFALLCPGAAAAQDAAAETAIRAIVAEQAAAWNAGDGAKYSARVAPDVAIVDIDNELRGIKTMPGAIAVPPGGVLKTQLMEVYVRRNGQWWIEAYHNVDTKPGPTR
jgi:ketosteroid isomerase-like protein